MSDKIYLTPAVEKTLRDLEIELPKPGQKLWSPTGRAVISKDEPLCEGLTEYTNSQKMYAAGCDAYGWEESLTMTFGKSRSVYAGGATKEGYGVWCPSVTALRLREDAMKRQSIQNYVGDDKIVELVFKEQTQHIGQDDPEDKRVTFVKLFNETYVFYGVVERVFIKKFERYGGRDTLMIRVYDKISDVYPLPSEGAAL